MHGNKLRAQFALQGKSVPTVAEGINLSKKALYRKLNGDSQFTLAEIKRLVEYLGLDEATTYQIFLR